MLFLLILGCVVTYYLYTRGVRCLFTEACNRGSWLYAWQYLIGYLATNTLFILMVSETLYCVGWSLLGGEEKLLILSPGTLALFIVVPNLIDALHLLQQWQKIREAIARHRRSTW